MEKTAARAEATVYCSVGVKGTSWLSKMRMPRLRVMKASLPGGIGVAVVALALAVGGGAAAGEELGVVAYGSSKIAIL